MKHAHLLLTLALLASCTAPSLTNGQYRVESHFTKHPLKAEGCLSPQEVEQVNDWLHQRCTLGTRSLSCSRLASESFHAEGLSIHNTFRNKLIIQAPLRQYSIAPTNEDAPFLRLLHLRTPFTADTSSQQISPAQEVQTKRL